MTFKPYTGCFLLVCWPGFHVTVTKGKGGPGLFSCENHMEEHGGQEYGLHSQAGGS